MAEKDPPKSNRSKYCRERSSSPSESGARYSSRSNVRTTAESTQRSDLRELGQYRQGGSGGQRWQRTAELRSKFEPLGTAGGGTQPEIIPDARQITVLPSHRDNKKNTTSSSATVPTDSDKKRGALGGAHFGGSSTSSSARPGGAVRVQTQLSKPGVKDEASSEIQTTASPPVSPSPDDATVKRKPGNFPHIDLLPNQTNPSGPSGGLFTATKGGRPPALALVPPTPVSTSHPSKGPQSLPSSPSTSSGNIPSGGDLLSAGSFSSGEHPIAQANSLDGKARLVGGTRQSSFGIDPHHYTPTREDHQPDSGEFSATTGGDPQASHATAANSTLSQATARLDEDETQQPGENTVYHDKMLLATNSITMSTTGRPVLNTSMSEDSGIRTTQVQHEMQIQALQSKIKELETRNAELETRNTELQRHLNVRHGPMARDEHPMRERCDGSHEEDYTHRHHLDHLACEVKRLTPFVAKAEKLERDVKRLEGLYREAKRYEDEVVKQVSIVSKKEAEIVELQKQLSIYSSKRQGSESTKEKAGHRLHSQVRVARLEEELKNKDREIARVNARLKKSEKSKSVDDIDGEATPDVMAIKADYDRQLAHKEAMINKLKKRVTELAEVAQQPMPAEVVSEKLGDEKGTEAKSTSKQRSDHAGEESSPELVGVVMTGGVEKQQLLGGVEGDNEELVRELRRDIEEKDKKIKKLSEQLQGFMQTASNVGKIVEHSKGQSGKILKLKKQLEVAEAKSEAQHKATSVGDSEEVGALKLKLTESLETTRRFHLQNKILEDENRRLKSSVHEYANTKVDEAEEENRVLKQTMKSLNAELDELSQHKVALDENNQMLAERCAELNGVKSLLEQKIIGQQASIQNLQQELRDTKQRATENALTVERCQLELEDLRKQNQDLRGEKEALKAMADVYQEDFNNERKDRESAHAQKSQLEERFKAEVATLKEQLQRVSADNGRLSTTMREKEKQMLTERASLQQQLEEKHQYIEVLKADVSALQGEVQSKTQQVKQYKKQVDQFRGELDRCHSDMEAYKQHAEQHKHLVESTVHQRDQSEQAVRVLQEENNRLQREVNMLKSREHLHQYGKSKQGGRRDSPISVEEFMKEREKLQETLRRVRELEVTVEELTTQKVMVISENEDLKKRLASNTCIPSSRSPPPVTVAGVSSSGRPPGYPGHKGQVGSALPNPVRPMAAPHHRLGPQMKSSSVDSGDFLSSRGHSDSPHVQPVPSISVSGSNLPPSSGRPEAAAYGSRERRQQLGNHHQGQHGRRSLTSSIPSPQRDGAVPQPFQQVASNAQMSHGRGYPYSSADGSRFMMTNADEGGGTSSPPTNIKFPPPAPPAASTATSGGEGVPLPVILSHPSGSSSGGAYPHTSPHHVPASASGAHVPHHHFPGQQYVPARSHAAAGTSVSHAASLAQSSAGGVGSSSSRVPPFTGHGPSVPTFSVPPVIAGDPNQPIVIYQDSPHHYGQQQQQQQQQPPQHHLSPPLDDAQGSGPTSLPSLGSGGLQQVPGQAPSGGHIQQPPGRPRDDMYLQHMQKVGGGGYGYQHQHVQGAGSQPGGYHTQFDEVEKDSSPPSSMMPPPHHGAPLSLNQQSIDQSLQAPQSRRKRYSHQMPISPDHSKKNLGDSAFGEAAGQQKISRGDVSEPSHGGGVHGMMRNDQGRGNILPLSSQQQFGQGSHLPAQHHHNNLMGGPAPNQPPRPASSFVKSPVQESSLGPRKLPPSMQKNAATSMYVPQHDQQYKGGGNIPDPDSDVVSNVSSESGMSSPHGGSQVNVNINTLEKGIDGDIRRAARNVKKQIAGQESPAGAKGGVQAPLDPNLICPSCGLQFRIGEIQKFKRHASTCIGT